MAEKRQTPSKKSPGVNLNKTESSVPFSSSDKQMLDFKFSWQASSSPGDTKLSEAFQQASLHEQDKQVVLRSHRTKNMDDSTVQQSFSSYCKQLSDAAQALGSPYVKKQSDSAQASLQVKDEEVVLRSHRTHIKKMDGSSVPRPDPSSNTQLSGTAQTSSSAGDTAQATEDVQEEEFVETQHPTGGLRDVAWSVMDLEPSVMLERHMSLPELGTASMVPMPDSPTAKTPQVSGQRKPSKRPCSDCCPSLCSAGSVCSHITRASRHLEFGSQTTQTQIPIDHRNPVFGVKLEDDVADSGQDVPRVVVRCVAIIEQWCQQNKADCVFVYQPTKFPEQIKAIRAAFTEGKDADLGTIIYEVESYAGVLKEYLRELPDPVIPEDMYSMFMDFVMSGRVEGTEFRTISDLVHAMPARHRSTLQALLRHFTRILRWQDEGDPEETYRTLICEVSHILIRPPWSKIGEIKDYIKVHNDMLIELIRAGCWGEERPNLPIVMPFKPPAVAPRKGSLEFPAQLPDDRLRIAPWYWGKISNAKAHAIVKKRPEGSFLVRDSSQPGNYVLVLRTTDGVILIRIMCKDNACGFVTPLEYPSVVTLIHTYRSKSMSPYNRTVTTKLLHPVMCRIGRAVPNSIHEQLRTFLMINKTYRHRRALYSYLKQWDTWLESDLPLNMQATGAYHGLLKMLEEQIRNHKENNPSANVEADRLHALHDTVLMFKVRLEDYLHKQKTTAYLHNGEMMTIKEEIMELKSQLDDAHFWLKARGCTQDYIENLENLDESLWLVNLQPPDAESLLLNTHDGTFLIRRKREDIVLPGDGYTHGLSVQFRGEVLNCMIYHKNNCYGLTEITIRFKSLKDLVDYHCYTPLDSRRSHLNVCLLFPANINKFIDPEERNEQHQAAQEAPEGQL